MEDYFNNLDPIIKDYFKILSDEIPNFLYDYINTPEMMRLDKISAMVGCDYTKFIPVRFWYSSLSHSIGVALIIWHFTKDKKQTLAGLFHDIATPAFKHCIDFLNGDYEKQESTEEFTIDIIKNSKEIMELLKRDNISLEEVCDYKIYPIADNDMPKLSADRLEYSFSDELVLLGAWKVKDIENMYNSLTVLKNEDGIDEIGFTDIKQAEKFIDGASLLWYIFQSNEDKLKTQFIADTIKKIIDIGEISKEDLYRLSEAEIIEKIENCKDKSISDAFKKFREVEVINEGEVAPKNVYTVSLKVKRRYIVPLVNDKRITEVSEISKYIVDGFLGYESFTCGWFDFDF